MIMKMQLCTELHLVLYTLFLSINDSLFLFDEVPNNLLQWDSVEVLWIIKIC